MAGFDGERYLRLAGERMVLGRLDDGAQGSGWSSPIVDVAAALVAIDAITVDEAQVIARDYEVALSLRGDRRSRGGLFRATGMGAGAEPEGRPLGPSRVVACDATVATAWGSVEVHHVTVGSDGVSLDVTITETGSGNRGMAPTMGTLADDEGNRSPGMFSGGGGGDTYRGRLETSGLSPSTAWIELDGHRIDLGAAQEPTPVEIESLAEASAAERYLWKLLPGSARHGPRSVDTSSIETTIEVLVAAGAVAADAPVLRQVRAVVHAGETNDRTDPDLPAPWASILARTSGAFHGSWSGADATRTVVVDATTPPIDGIFVRVDALTITGDEVALKVAVSPASALSTWGPSLRTQELSWWAEDDRGNHYLGSVTSSGGSPGHAEGTVELMPSLDDRATELRLLPTAVTERAVIRVPLADRGAPT